MKNDTIVKVFISFLFFHQILFSQVTTTGKISGKITAQDTHEPLIGCSVFLVEQTRYGASTDINGEFFILNVPVGTYSLKASMVGYGEVVVTNLRVSAGLTVTQNIELTQSNVQMKEVIVEAVRPLIQKDQTNSAAIATAQEIKNLPLRGVEGVVTVQTGVVAGRGTNNNTFYTRGGRANETAIYVDGFEQNNILTGEATVSLNTNAVEEIQTQTGGFNAEYGRALSGVIDVVTKEAAPKYSAQLETESDFFMPDKDARGFNVYNLSLSGPLIPGYEPLTLFFSGEVKNLSTSRASQGDVGRVFHNGSFEEWDKGYLPNDRDDGFSLQSKLAYHITPQARLSFNFLHSNGSQQTYFDIYKYNLDHAPWKEDINTTFSGTLTLTLDNSTFMEISAAYFSTDHFSGDGVYRKNFQGYLESGNDNPRNLYDPDQGGFISPAGWERWQGNVSDTTGMADYLSSNGLNDYLVSADRYDPYGLYFAPGYAGRFFQLYSASYINPKVNLVSQLDEHHQIKVGAEYRYNSLSYYENLETNRGVNATLINAYGYTLDGTKNEDGNGGLLDGERHPFDLAFYAQDKIEEEGLVVNAGIRFDFFNANTKTLLDEKDPLGANQVASGDPLARKADAGDFGDTKTESQISPRLGLAFPVTDQTVFHFNYGKFFQQPNLTDLYYGTKLIEFKAISGSPTYSTQNPNLKPEQTTAYEIGITHQLADNVRFSATAYYKDTKDLINVRYTPTTAPGGAALYLISNQDYGTIKGLDLNFEVRRVGVLSGRFAYSLAFAEGTGSTSRENFNAVWLNYTTAKFTQPLSFDQRHTLSANVDIRNQKGEGEGLLEDAGINLLLTARSGFPYTPSSKYNAAASTVSIGVPKDNPIDGVNSRYGPWTFRIDLKMDKEFNLGPFSADVYLRVLNLLDTKNLLAVYQATGEANSDGYLGTNAGIDNTRQFDTDNKIYTTGEDFVNKYNDRLSGVDVNVNGANERKYDTPREIRLGIILIY